MKKLYLIKELQEFDFMTDEEAEKFLKQFPNSLMEYVVEANRKGLFDREIINGKMYCSQDLVDDIIRTHDLK